MVPELAVYGSTLFQHLEHISHSHPDRIALSDSDRSWSYRELCAEAEVLATGLVAAAGTDRGAVAVISENRSEVCLCWLAGSRSGLVTSILNPHLTPAELAKPLSRLQPRLVVTPAPHLDKVSEALDIARFNVPMVTLEEGSRTARRVIFYGEMMDGDPYKGPHPEGDDIFEVGWTSGTTSDPKGVALSHFGVVSHWAAVGRGIGLRSSDVAYVVTPLYHQSGLRHTTLVTWLAGGRAHLASRFSPSLYWDDVRNIGATYTCLVPTMTQILRTATPNELQAYPMRRPGYCYGSTETGVPISVPHSTPAADLDSHIKYRAGAVFAGWATPGCEVKITGEADAAPQEGTEGEILIKSPGMLRRYWNDPEASESSFVDGWFKSGDKGLRGRNGSIYFVDRLRDLVRRGGENIACREIEDVLSSHPSIEQAAVFSVPDPLWGEEAKAVVIPSKGATIDPNNVWDWCQQRLAAFKVPRYLEFRNTLPVSTSGKVQKAVLRQEGLRLDRSADRKDRLPGSSS